MAMARDSAALRDSSVEAYLLGQVDFEVCLNLQQRLVYELSGRDDGQIGLVVCEHAPLITIGREGSRGHIRFEPDEMAARGLSVRWLNRGGGCLLHAPGQLAVYPIVPLAWHGFSVGEYLRRLHAGLEQTLVESGVSVQPRPGRHDVWGRSGPLACIGAAVKGGMTYHGAFVNVSPAMSPFQGVECDPERRATMSSLAVERQQAVRIQAVRERLVRNLTAAWGCQRLHVYTSHPLLKEPGGKGRNSKVG